METLSALALRMGVLPSVLEQEPDEYLETMIYLAMTEKE